MKVRELIALLLKQDKESDVAFLPYGASDPYTEVSNVEYDDYLEAIVIEVE